MTEISSKPGAYGVHDTFRQGYAYCILQKIYLWESF